MILTIKNRGKGETNNIQNLQKLHNLISQARRKKLCRAMKTVYLKENWKEVNNFSQKMDSITESFANSNSSSKCFWRIQSFMLWEVDQYFIYLKRPLHHDISWWTETSPCTLRWDPCPRAEMVCSSPAHQLHRQTVISTSN